MEASVHTRVYRNWLSIYFCPDSADCYEKLTQCDNCNSSRSTCYFHSFPKTVLSQSFLKIVVNTIKEVLYNVTKTKTATVTTENVDITLALLQEKCRYCFIYHLCWINLPVLNSSIQCTLRHSDFMQHVNILFPLEKNLFCICFCPTSWPFKEDRDEPTYRDTQMPD